jgi:hypothetical protein
MFSNDHLRCRSSIFPKQLILWCESHSTLLAQEVDFPIHPYVMLCFRTICSSLHCRLRLSPSAPEDKNPSSSIEPHTITSDVRPYAPASRLNNKLANNFSLSKSFVTTSALFSAEVGPLFEYFAPHCTSSPNSQHLFHSRFFFSVALRPNAGHGLLILEVFRSHTTTHHSR